MKDLLVSNITASDLEKNRKLLLDVGKEAGKIALTYFNADNKVWTKSCNSPVSQADFAVDKFLRETLMAERSHYGWLSEETEDDSSRLTAQTVFVVDPIDGTRGFLEGDLHWCVSVAIVHRGRPLVGVLDCPAIGETYSAALGQGSKLNGQPLVMANKREIKTITGSKKLNAIIKERYPSSLEVLDFIPSLAYRIAMVAADKVDAGIARAGANDWDLAAADIILSEAGGFMTDPLNKVHEYNKIKTATGALVAAGPGRHQTLLDLAKAGGFLQ